MVKIITISIEFTEKLKAMANQEGKIFSTLVKEALKEWIITVRRKRGKALLSLVKKRSLVDEEEALKAIEVMRREKW